MEVKGHLTLWTLSAMTGMYTWIARLCLLKQVTVRTEKEEATTGHSMVDMLSTWVLMDIDTSTIIINKDHTGDKHEADIKPVEESSQASLEACLMASSKPWGRICNHCYLRTITEVFMHLIYSLAWTINIMPVKEVHSTIVQDRKMATLWLDRICKGISTHRTRPNSSINCLM